MMRQCKPATLTVTAIAVSGLLTSFLPHRVDASSLTNRDQVTRQISVISGAERKTTDLSAGGVLKQFCPKGCVIRIDGDPKRDFVLEGRERVTVEDGLLYYEGEMPAEDQTAKK